MLNDTPLRKLDQERRPVAAFSFSKKSFTGLSKLGFLGLLFAILLIIVIAAVGKGAVKIAPNQVISIIFDEVGLTSFFNKFGLSWDIPYEKRQQSVLMVIRLPRVVLGVMIGSTLAISGASIQGLFRNPLADPGLIGISSGAALGAALMIVWGDTTLKAFHTALGTRALPVAAFVGGVITTLIIYRLSTVGGRTSILTMLLAGIAINALMGAGIGMMTYVATEEELRDITFWSLGSLGRANWETVRVLLPFMLLTLLPMPFLARSLNAFLLGEAEASHLGINVERIKLFVVVLVAMSVGAGVAVAGIIGFIGLVVPHVIRLIIGPDHRYLLPASALLGASLLVGADLIARTVAVPRDVPIGIVTALAGCPFFLYLLLRDRGRIAF